MAPSIVLGVDVGIDITCAVVMLDSQLIGSSKQQNTDDVMTGIMNAIDGALSSSKASTTNVKVDRIHIGTTQFTDAVMEGKHLEKIAVIRLCGPASIDLPPFSDFPENLKEKLDGGAFTVNGGYFFKGKQAITDVKESDINKVIEKLKTEGVKNIVVSGIYSFQNPTQEQEVGDQFSSSYKEASVTLSHTIAELGILDRENASILNESLKPYAKKVVLDFTKEFQDRQLECPLYFTKNDGTLLSADEVKQYPICTFATGQTNSMRGASFLSGVSHGIVADIGDTSIVVGVIKKNFPTMAPAKLPIADVQINNEMPDTVSGSIDPISSELPVGSKAAGYHLITEGPVSGGRALASMDKVKGRAKDKAKRKSKDTRGKKIQDIKGNNDQEAMEMLLERLVNSVKYLTTGDDKLILVGDGSDVIPPGWKMPGISDVITPAKNDVANGVGAAVSAVSGSADICEKNASHEAVKDKAKHAAMQQAVHKGAIPNSVQIVKCEGIPLEGHRFRVFCQAVGELISFPKQRSKDKASKATRKEASKSKHEERKTGSRKADTSKTDCAPSIQFAKPLIDLLTGEWLFSEYDVECLSVGAAILGSGGGGSVRYGRLQLLQKLREGKKIRVINPMRYQRESATGDCAVALCYMGAPSCMPEMLFSKKERETALNGLKNLYKYGGFKDGHLQNSEGVEVVEEGANLRYINDYKPPTTGPTYPELKVTALMTPEIGGGNSMQSLVFGAELDIPVLDCDFMGRAFPELEMMSFFLYGGDAYPSLLGNATERDAVTLYANNAETLENHFRDACVEMGSTSAFIMSPLSPIAVTKRTVLYTLSHARNLGDAVLRAREARISPVKTILEYERGILLAQGKIISLEEETVAGFTEIKLHIEGEEQFDQQKFFINVRNENLIIKNENDDTLAMAPDIITLVDPSLGEAISSDEVRLGMPVAVVGLPCSTMLNTPQALKVLTPKKFGVDGEYSSLGKYVEPEPIPLP